VNRSKLLVAVLCLLTVNVVAYWFTHPRDARAVITGGEVVGEWRCEILDAGDEEQTARWLDRYAPRGPAGLVRLQGSVPTALVNMLCVHAEIQESWEASGGAASGGSAPPPPDDPRSGAIDLYFATCDVEDSASRRTLATNSWNQLLGMGLDEARIWKLAHELEPGCSYITFQAAILAMKSRSER